MANKTSKKPAKVDRPSPRKGITAQVAVKPRRDGTAKASKGRSLISVMLVVPDAAAALAWYKRALGAAELWNLGSVIWMEADGAPVFPGESERNGWETPANLGIRYSGSSVACASPRPFNDLTKSRS